MHNIAYLGPPGTFSEQAARDWLAGQQVSAEFVPLDTIPEVLMAVAGGRVSFGVVPVENSIEGTVNLTLDLLLQEKGLRVRGEVVQKIRHCLVGRKKVVGGSIRVIYSHPQALAQCRQYLQKYLPDARLQQSASTAEAAYLVSIGASDLAAISSLNAARRYGLEIYADNIQDYPDNKTRFMVVGRDGGDTPTGRDKTSLVVALPENRPGGLYSILKEFADADINLTKIESRPTKKELGEYLFFLDCLGHCEEVRLQSVLERMRAKVALLQVLGSYPRDEMGRD